MLGAAAGAGFPHGWGPPASAASPQTIRLIVGGAAGSSSDTEGRAFAPFFERHLPPADVTIVNRPGQFGLEAYRLLADAGADGRTLGWTSTPSLPARCVDQQAPALLQRLTLLAAVQREPIALVAPSGGATDVAGLRALVAAGAPIGTPPSGSPSHLTALRLQDMLGTRLNLVVFPAAASVRQAVTEGNVAAAVLALGEAIIALREGRMAGIGLAADAPAQAFPTLPPLSADGLKLTAAIYRGIAAPVGLEPIDATALTTALRGVAEDPEFIAYANAHGFEATWLDGATWTARTTTEYADLTQTWQRSPWRDTRPGETPH